MQNLNTPNLWILMRARANLKNYTSHVLLLSKVYYVWAQKKYRGVICHNMENDIKFEKELVSKNGVRNLANFDATLKICTLMVFFWQKYVMIELKKCRGVLHHYAEYRCKLWRKNDLRFHKSHEEFVNFTGALKICTLGDFFCPRYLILSKKIIEELCRDTEGWCNI